MFKEFFLFELKFRLKKKIMAYAFFLVMFLMAFLSITTDTVKIGGAIGSINVNSPFVIMQTLSVMSVIGIFIIVPLMATVVIRDFDEETYPAFFTSHATKFSYLFGRFTGAFAVTLFCFSGLVAGLMLGSVMPWVEAERVGPFLLEPYLFSWFAFILANTLIGGALFFMCGTLTRSILYTYVAVVVFFVGWAIASQMLRELEYRPIAALIDPFGVTSFAVQTQYWTVAERNTMTLALEGRFLLNRIIWLSVAALCLFITWWRFKFSEPRLRGKRKKRLALTESFAATPVTTPRELAPASRDFSPLAFFKQFLSQTKQEFLGVIKSVAFIVIVLFGLFNVFGRVVSTDRLFGTEVHMVTRVMLQNIQGGYSLFLIIVMTIYGGELIWRGRANKVSEYYDALPVPEWLPFASKLAALIGVTAFMQLLAMLFCIAWQFFSGFYDVEYGLYLKTLFVYQGSGFVLLAVLIMFIHALVNNKYVGHTIVVLFYVVNFIAMPALEWNHNLYIYGGTPDAPYSDMNAYGHFVMPVTWFSIYWAFCALVLAVISNLFWVRGTDSGLKARLQTSHYRLNPQKKLALAIGLAAFVLTGGFAFYNTNVINKYTTENDQKRQQVEYEQKYKKFERRPQPRIVDVFAEVDIFPEQRDVDIRGRYVLVNKTGAAIDSLHIRQPQPAGMKLTINELTAGESERVYADSMIGYYIYKLQSPLLPADSMTLSFDYAYRTHGFVNNGSNTEVVYNGTFFNNAATFPHIGYSRSLEMADRNDRRKHQLPPRARMHAIGDSAARYNTYLGDDADWVRFETIVSTSPEQIAISPGYLQREWQENGRRYFHYKTDAPILNFYSFLSARYEVYREKWNGIDIEIYYHQPHNFNLDKMVKAIKHSLDYFSKNFSPYQHRQMRIVEFPRYATFAQSFPNTVPYSESIGFIANLKDVQDIDYVYYVTAHEVAHQWWAHQVIGADVQGATVTSETMAQYSALMVMEKEYGKDKMKKFLKYELDRYLSGRANEFEKELPLIYNENQPYIHYRKGSLVMYALRDYIGEEKLNAALAKYVKAVAYQPAPFTTSLELLDYIRPAIPDSLSYIIADWFETITLYDNRALAASYSQADDGRYEVHLELASRKLRADSLGVETEIPVADWIEVGVIGKDGKELYLQKHKIASSELKLTLVVDEEPVEAGIDPYVKLIDRNPDDNVRKVAKI